MEGVEPQSRQRCKAEQYSYAQTEKGILCTATYLLLPYPSLSPSPLLPSHLLLRVARGKFSSRGHGGQDTAREHGGGAGHGIGGRGGAG